ncbi:EthD domain-containing protein [Celerinatantimonas sp. MCCC 1A17872]|uniref:EthD domain-containing protein n=1 Tax=Celerinatantimonas sp. MCCC 1A17872 TaxID=3177514 RepID=UPI0038BFF7E1
MHTVAYLFRRKPGMSRETFFKLYNEHKKVMAGNARGLISYTQHPIREPQKIGDTYTTTEYDDFDALSIYTYRSAEDSEFSNQLTAISSDSERFIDFETMISLPLNKEPVI